MRLQTWRKWEPDVEREGMGFEPAAEYEVWPRRSHLKPYQAAVLAAREALPRVREFSPHAVVADILTIAAALAADMAGRPWVTLIPHVLPMPSPGFPPYSMGARLPRTVVGRLGWRALDPLVRGGLHRGRREFNGARERVGLPPLPWLHNGISRRLALVGTFPQLEYPRAEWPPFARVTGPLLWEQPTSLGSVDLPPGDDPLVLVAPSTVQDPRLRMVRAALDGLADEPVRVLASSNRRPITSLGAVPANARVVEWLSYSATMPRCAAVICHAGHGTVARTLASGVPMVACPDVGDMAENAARVAWAGAGVSLPRRLVTPRGVRLAVRKLLGEPRFAARAAELGRWAEENDGASAAADALEELAA